MNFELWPIVYLIVAIILMIILCCVIPWMKSADLCDGDATLDSSHQLNTNRDSSCSKETMFQMQPIKPKPNEEII